MKKSILSLCIFTILFTSVFAQKSNVSINTENSFFNSERFEEITTSVLNQPFDSNNAIPGTNIEYCMQHKLHNALMNEPEYAALIAKRDSLISEELANPPATAKATTFYIPVVFHLLHNGGAEFISDDQIKDALDILNRDYDLLNPDAASVHNDFNASNPLAIATPSDVDIQFRFATIAPDGTCFNGITHTVSSAGGSSSAIVNAVTNGNDVYQGTWAGNKYMNVFIAADIGASGNTLAYTYTPIPGFSQMSNGIYIRPDYLGSIGTSSPSYSRTLTHEVGHWFNLEHVWGGNNDPGNASSCSTDDGISDTPRCIGTFSCNQNMNSCDQDNAFWGFDIRDNVENYMDYAGCSKMFTQGQVDRMRTAAQSSVAGRNNLKTTNNLNQTGANGVVYLCRAEFSANKTTTCSGGTIQFTDESFNVVNGWTWTFAGGTPASSTDQDPLITYNTPGLYEVTLSATDGSSTDVETKTSYIRVLPAEATLPILENFESYTTLSNLVEWDIYDSGNNAKFDITNTAGHTGLQSAKLANYGQSAGNIDEISSAPIDLSVINSGSGVVTLSFRYAYSQRFSGDDEWLKVFITNDCGDSWAQRKTIHGDMLSTNVTNSSWTPASQADWTTVHMTNVTSSYWVNDFRYKFRFESDGGNNFYLDNINIYSSAPSDVLIVGLEENGEIADLILYPNPADDELNVKFSVGNAQEVQLVIQDVTGKIVQNVAIYANEGSNLVMLDTQALASGMYFLNVNVNGIQQTMQFIVK